MVSTNDAEFDPARVFARAIELHAKGELEHAARFYDDLIRFDPHDVRALTNLGLVRLQQNRLDDAVHYLDRALAVDPAAVEPLLWRGEVLRRRGALEPAIAAFRGALAVDPNLAPALFNLALAEAELGHRDAAEDLWARFSELRPADTRVCRELGRLAYQHGDYDDAANWYSRQLERTPDDPGAICDLASALLPQHAYVAAGAVLAPLLARKPDHVRALRLQGQALLGRNEREQALATLRRAMALDPNDAETAFQTGLALDRLARLEEAITCFARAAVLAPGKARYRSAMGVAHFNLAEHARAVADYRAALALDPGFAEARSNLLMALQHEDPCDHEQLLAEHVAWADAHARVAAMPRASFTNLRDPRRRLKIGYVSPRFCGGPLAHYFLPLLEGHDRSAVHVACYAVGDVRDDATRAMQSLTDAWIDAAALDDDTLVGRIRRDGIDILVDLVGHCPGQRLGVFARRGAPVQITWLDYVGTTGIPAIDYLITDVLHTPLDSPQRFSERLLRLPETRLCYRPPRPLPALSASPFAQRGVVTFGCFNRLAKLGPDVVATWSRILARVPDARLVLKATAFEAAETRAIVARRFEQHGVDARRLDLRPYTPEAQMMQEYADVDIALDPFPYNGCTTTCDALTMGVPVVTLEGSTLAGRHGVALLTNAGLDGNVAHSRDEYVELAVRLAACVATAPSRAEVRERFLASPLCDAPRFARAFEQACRDAWTAWCTDGN